MNPINRENEKSKNESAVNAPTPAMGRAYSPPKLMRYGAVGLITGSMSATSLVDTKSGTQTANLMLP
jgi:hypothetical protein